MSGASDVDLVVVYPVGAERAALDVRRNLVAQIGMFGVADVTLLSEQEVISTGFWCAENALLLSSKIASCDRSASGPRNADAV